MDKKEHGIFYTTNYKYILNDFIIPKYVKIIIEPFCGKGDLLKFIDNKNIKLEMYDLNPQNKNTAKRDTLKNPPNYKNKFVLTNPPYLARNKSKDKSLFDKYNTNDLYKCFIKEIIKNKPIGGIIIIPLNFLTSTRPSDLNLRKEFIKNFSIQKINIFETQVFEDTKYNVCSILFENSLKNTKVEINIYPTKTKLFVQLNEKNNYMIGGEIFKLKSNKYKISRLMNKQKQNTNLLLKTIDDTTKINLSFSNKIMRDTTKNNSNRAYATLTIEPKLSENKQKKLCVIFNNYLTKMRKKYHSLFLTNFRENSRKRISFTQAYQIIGYLLETNKF